MKRNQRSALQNLALISQVGIMMLVPILGCILVGVWIDKKLGTGMIATTIFIVLGVGAAFRNLIQLSAKKTEEYKNNQSPEAYVREFEKKVKASSEESKHKK